MQTAVKSQLDLAAVNAKLTADKADASAIIAWAAQQFGSGLAMTSSFGGQSAIMLHLASRVVPNIPVIVIDTGYLFPETYQFIEELTQKFSLNVKVFSPLMTAARQEALYGKLWEQGEEGMDKYHAINKVEPMQRALKELGVTAWLAGLRRDQSDYRANLRTVEVQDGVHKIHPILDWSTRDVHQYLKTHGLSYHPLYDKGYKSVGDWHSTRPITADQPERSGRFHGLKQECGIHIPSTPAENQSAESANV